MLISDVMLGFEWNFGMQMSSLSANYIVASISTPNPVTVE